MAGTSDPFIDTVILQSVNLLTSLCSLPLARAFGRRTLLLSGFGMCAVSMFIIAVVYSVTSEPRNAAVGKALVAMLCVFNGTYGATVGPLSWVAAGEMTANRLRSHAFGIAMAIGFVFAWLTTFTTPYFINGANLNWGAKGLTLSLWTHSSEANRSIQVAWIWWPSNLITFIFICMSSGGLYYAVPGVTDTFDI